MEQHTWPTTQHKKAVRYSSSIKPIVNKHVDMIILCISSNQSNAMRHVWVKLLLVQRNKVPIRVYTFKKITSFHADSGGRELRQGLVNTVRQTSTSIHIQFSMIYANMVLYKLIQHNMGQSDMWLYNSMVTWASHVSRFRWIQT